MTGYEFSHSEGYTADGEAEYIADFTAEIKAMTPAQIDNLNQDDFDLAVKLGLLDLTGSLTECGCCK